MRSLHTTEALRVDPRRMVAGVVAAALRCVLVGLALLVQLLLLFLPVRVQ